MFFHNKSVFHNIALAVSVGVMRGKAGIVASVPSVSNPPLEVRMGLASNVGTLPVPLALGGTELSLPIAYIGNIRTALATKVLRSVTPAVGSVALTRAVFRRFLTPVFGVKIGIAVDALKRQCCSLHSYIITLEEKYCEIAVRRLQQAVLPLGV